MRIPGALVALAALAALASVPTRAHAQTRTVTCESRDDARNDCYVANLDPGSVSLDRKLSKSDCDKGQSWGTSRDNIWVSRGCRATFSYRVRSGNTSGGGGRYGTIACESKGGGRHDCYVANLDRESVTMDKQLSESPCIRGRSWDVSGDNIWVRDGCRARFAYATRAGGVTRPSVGTGGSITCESQGGRRECYVANLDPESVTMDERLSQATCIRGSSWGASGSTIWVSQGCRARFGYVTRSGGSGQYNDNGYGGSSRSAREACIERASREWAVSEDNLEVTGTNRLDNGQTELLIKSKRTTGSCTVNSSGRVQRFSTW